MKCCGFVLIFSTFVLISCGVGEIFYRTQDFVNLTVVHSTYTADPIYSDLATTAAYDDRMVFLAMGTYQIDHDGAKHNATCEVLYLLDKQDDEWRVKFVYLRRLSEVGVHYGAGGGAGWHGNDHFAREKGGNLGIRPIIITLIKPHYEEKKIEYGSIYLGFSRTMDARPFGGLLIWSNVSLADSVVSLKKFEFDIPRAFFGYIASIGNAGDVGDLSLYIFGGCELGSGVDGLICSSEIYECSLSSIQQERAQWEMHKVKVKPSGRFHCGGLLYRGRYFVFGGRDDSHAFDDMWYYEIGKRRWFYDSNSSGVVCMWDLTRGKMCKPGGGKCPSARYGFSTFLLSDIQGTTDYMVVYGGMDISGNYMNDVWYYDLCKFQWKEFVYMRSSIFSKSKGGNKPAPRSFPITIPLNSGTKVVFVGGQYKDKFLLESFVIDFSHVQIDEFQNSVIFLISSTLFVVVTAATLVVSVFKPSYFNSD